MNSGGTDSFDYLLQLTKVLIAECRANRQETDRIELLLKRLAKQSGISYDNLSKNIIPDSWKDNASQKASPPTEAQKLISENFKLIYEIEKQEYFNTKAVALINNINEHFSYIKNFIDEQNAIRERNIATFTSEKLDERNKSLQQNYESLKTENEETKKKMHSIIKQFEKLLKEVDWDRISKDSRDYSRFKKQLEYLQDTYQVLK
ncbi:AHL_G0041140.mRNA.1.CDS.1 [Saccharomyces cerevisiae]|nr:Far3p [Saccharomyces cerevisiae YJM1078]AJS63668.1 Far3p [Saccharomyces cerevisiae YJM248]AJS81140.1 Far3p [Saccharomyces cerevisiae YJM1252]CAI4676577.1 AIE_G0040860.mRNA.1.CDS.1 [Saccharomyces cerevisiae]CAI4895319.1 AHL_G0041140.mRNA.1.CDS.1 [Saccharomyces cerevisiae]